MVGWFVGRQPRRCWVRALEDGMSRLAKWASQPKYSGAFSGVMEMAGTLRPRAMASAMSRIRTPSSATAL